VELGAEGLGRGAAQLRLSNLEGRLLWQQTLLGLTSGQSYGIELPPSSAGRYLLELRGEGFAPQAHPVQR